MDRLRSTVPNNLVSSRLDPYADSSSASVRCHGPLCKSFICYVDTLPIGHSVLIQLKAILRLKYFQSVRWDEREDEFGFCLCLEIRSFESISHHFKCQCSSARNSSEISCQPIISPTNCFIKSKLFEKARKSNYFSLCIINNINFAFLTAIPPMRSMRLTRSIDI